MEDILKTAIFAARAGGEVLMSVRLDDLGIEEKDSHVSIVTKADIEAQEAIVKHIAAVHPDHRIVGEEGSSGNPRSDNVWYIDPLDGTSNYSHGLPFFCVSIAFCDRNGPAVGVIYDPSHDTLYHALRGKGAFRGGERLRVATTSKLRRALVSTQVQSDSSAMLDRFGRRMRLFAESTRAVRSFGTPALSLAFVASGYIDAFCEPDMSPWDVAAGTLLIEEAGGRVSTFEGASRPIGSSLSILATNGTLHDDFVRLLTDEARSGDTGASVAERQALRS